MDTSQPLPLPLHIIDAVDRGQCTLFLGAGASKIAGAPSGDDLRDLVAAKFLAGEDAKDWGLSLESAVSLACAQGANERDSIEKLVRATLLRLVPSPSHLRIPWFRWQALVTTNYDRLIETAYDSEPRAVQTLIPILNEKDISDIESAEHVPLFKPHGCISQRRDMSLSSEGIYLAKQKRRLLFTYIEMLHLLGPVIYIGYSFRDVHILDMIYELSGRLGPYRRPILFVTLQRDQRRAEMERRWFAAPPLEGIYLAYGFDTFMESLSNQLTPAIVPSMIIRQMAPCRTVTFASGGVASDRAYQGAGGEWEYWLTYTIRHKDGYAGVIFERLGEPIDISKYEKVTFQLNVPPGPRQDEPLEVKLESTLKQHEDLLGIKKLKEWQEVSIDLRGPTVPRTRLRRIVLADTGGRASIGQECAIGLRNVRFE